MELPAELLINKTLEQGYVYYYPDSNFVKNTDPHYFVVLNKNPHNDSFLLLSCAGSRIEKIKAIIQRKRLPPSTFVSVAVGECEMFRKETAFDCNTVHKRTKEELISLAAKRILFLKGKIPSPILKRIIAGVLSSPSVAESIKIQIQ
jgi:hypothetical protein